MTKKTILQSLPSDTEIMYEDIVWLLGLMKGEEDSNLETYKHDLSIEGAPPTVKYPLNY